MNNEFLFGFQEGETIRINVKNKPSSGTGMLSAAGLSGGLTATGKPKALSLAPPPSGGAKLRSPLPPPPNDPVAARIASNNVTAVKGLNEHVKNSTDPFSDLSQLEVFFYFQPSIQVNLEMEIWFQPILHMLKTNPVHSQCF